LFGYMMLAGAIGIGVGIIAGMLFTKSFRTQKAS
jgi:hypothetical protein